MPVVRCLQSAYGRPQRLLREGQKSMNTLNAFLDRITSEPDPSIPWLVLADWLEDQGDPRSELVRLFYQPDYRRGLPQEQRAARVRKLLDCVPPLFENALNAHFAWVPPGTFWMGGGGGSP